MARDIDVGTVDPPLVQLETQQRGDGGVSRLLVGCGETLRGKRPTSMSGTNPASVVPIGFPAVEGLDAARGLAELLLRLVEVGLEHGGAMLSGNQSVL